MKVQELNVVIIGAGVGGLAAGALLAREGACVTVLEAQEYPGGCASTFSHKGYRFDAGATLGCGFHSDGPMATLGQDLGIQWPITSESVAWQYRHKSLHIDLSMERSGIIRRFPRSEPFWDEQSRLAKLLWHLSKKGISWPLKSAGDYGRLASSVLSGVSGRALLLKFVAKTTRQWLAAHSLDRDLEFKRFIDAQLLVSVQTTSPYANAINAAIALDLPSSGAYRVKGGIGTIAELLAAYIEKHGGVVLYGKEVIRIDSVRRQVIGLETSDGTALAADVVLANLTPDTLVQLTGGENVSEVSKQVSLRWSAFTLYLGMEQALFSDLVTHHLQIISKKGQFGEGNSIFVSFSPRDEPDRAPEGLCAVTISTHARPGRWFDAKERGEAHYMELKTGFTEYLLNVFSEQFPHARKAIHSLTAATPVTWERYTGRFRGYVGGYPQNSLFGVRNPVTRFENLFLVGDSIFPGQSLPGVVTGARRVVQFVRQKASKIELSGTKESAWRIGRSKSVSYK